MSTGRYDATHAVVRADGTEVRPGDIIEQREDGPVVFRLLTRVPGDGTGTNGKIIVDQPDWPGAERYPSNYGLRVEDRHVDYPHEPGYLIGCPGCEARCHCAPRAAQCVAHAVDDDDDPDDHEFGCTCIFCTPGA